MPDVFDRNYIPIALQLPSIILKCDGLSARECTVQLYFGIIFFQIHIQIQIRECTYIYVVLSVVVYKVHLICFFYVFSYFCSCRVAHIGSWHTVPLKSMLFSMRCLTFAQKLIFVCRLIIIILFFFSFRNFFCFKFVYMHVLFVCVCVFYMLHRHLR